MSEPRSIEEIEAKTAQIKEHINNIVRDAHDHAYALRQERPLRLHPVWGEEWRQAIWLERHAGLETGPLTKWESDERSYTMARWAREVQGRERGHDRESYGYGR